MNPDQHIGLYGKLPAYGDFIFRNLSSSFINPWDEWLQHFISASQEQIGDGWLDIYLTSPIWRFVLSPGVVDNKVWAGLMMPSVDRVGRYFPISIVSSFEPDVNPVKFLLHQQDWYNAVEERCLSALDGVIDADELVDSSIEAVQINESYVPTVNLGELGPAIIGLPGTDQQSLSNAIPYMMNAILTSSLTSFSVWQTSGSERVSPLMFSCQGLPPLGALSSMLDGQWQQRDWKIPYNLTLV